MICKSHPNKAVLKNKQKKYMSKLRNIPFNLQRGWIQINIFLFLCVLVHANIIWLSLVFNVSSNMIQKAFPVFISAVFSEAGGCAQGRKGALQVKKEKRNKIL